MLLRREVIFLRLLVSPEVCIPPDVYAHTYLKVVPQSTENSLISVVWCEWVRCADKIDRFAYQNVVKSN